MNKVKTFIKKDPLFDACPSCKSIGALRRSHSRNKKEKFISHLTIYKTYRCKKCGWRGYLKTITLTSSSFNSILIYAVIILITAIITFQILKRLL